MSDDSVRYFPFSLGISPDCGGLSLADGSVSIIDRTTVGGTATYSCDSGFKLDGTSPRTCQNDGNWSGAEPTCVPGMLILRKQ